MDTTQLKAYLKSAFELETALAESERIEKRYTDTFARLQIPVAINEPEMLPEIIDVPRISFRKAFLCLLATVVTCGLCYFLSTSIWKWFRNTNPWDWYSHNYSPTSLMVPISALARLVLVLLAVGISVIDWGVPIGLLFIGLNSIEDEIKAWFKNRRDVTLQLEKNRYSNNNSRNEYKAALQKEAFRQHKVKTLVAALIPEYEKISSQSREMRLILQQLYEQNVLHPSFRNLDAVSRLYYYIDTGMCTTLEGGAGAYMQYQNDLRMKEIVIAVNSFKASAERMMHDIIVNQHLTNTLLGKGVQSLGEIRGSLEQTNDTLEKSNRILNEMQTQQYTANSYLQYFSKKFDEISNAEDIIKINSYAMAMYQYNTLANENASAYLLTYPVHN